MELNYTLSPAAWQKADPLRQKGFAPYTVIRQEPMSHGKFRYAVKSLEKNEKDVKLHVIYLDGAASPEGPLAHVKNCQLRVEADQVVGINLDGDCAVHK